MLVPISWLREFVDLPFDAQMIADRLAMLGFPVEEIVRRPLIAGVIAGKIVKLEKHPNADRLLVGTIDVGAGAPLTIATAATNVAVGQVIPVATIGAQLPSIKIERRKMRGLESEGMLCSPDELALPTDWFEDGIMQLDADTQLGADVVALFGLADAVLDVEVTSNRVDAMSILGIARELSASYGTELRLPSFVNPGSLYEPANLAPQVTIESPDCTRFVAQRFENLTSAPAPAWMRIRLTLAGQRPIGNIVDISNYVMLETAQPLHFYDAAHVTDQYLIVRDARTGETLTTLDGVEHELTPAALVNADASGPLGLAGLMGGSTSEISAATTAIILEAANFNGARVRRMSMQFGFRSEASSRHEKLLSPALTDVGAARAAQLLIAGGATAYRPHAFGAELSPSTPIVLRECDVTRILGLHLDLARIAQHLRALGCIVTPSDDALSVVPPVWRGDITISADLVEEVARVEGYDNIESIVPSVPAHEISSAQYDLEDRFADVLAALGYDEIVTYSLHGRNLFERMLRAGCAPNRTSVEVRNPLSEDQRYLRFSVAPALLEHLVRADRPLRIFEIGHIFSQDDGIVSETPVVTLGFSADSIDEPAWSDTNFLRLKGDCEALIRQIVGRTPETTRGPLPLPLAHPGKSALMMIDGHEILQFGRLDPRLEKSFGSRLPVYMASIYLDGLPDYRTPVYHVPSRFPATYRDLALVVDLETTAAQIETTVAHAIGALCTAVRVFDEYRGAQIGAGKKSLAVRATMQRYDGTITDEEADAAVALALSALSEQLRAIIRQ